MPVAEPSTQMTTMSEPEAVDGGSKEQRIREIIVLPAPEVIDATEQFAPVTADQALAQMAEFVRDKTTQCQQLVQSSSAVSFTANYLQPRVISSELGAHLAKVYEALEVKKAEEFEQKLEDLAASGQEQTVESVRLLRGAFTQWAEFLASLDEELDRVAGPEKGQSELGQSGKEIQLVSQQGRLAQNGSLLSYVQSSTYSLMFLEVVASFAVQECYEHVKRMFDSLPEFNKLGCDILLLTRRPASGGSGFLKLIGMPFRMLLNESESMRQILMHRQSAQSMAGLRALHIYTEFLCNDQPLEIGRKPSGSGGEDNTNNGNGQLNAERQQQSGCILLDRQGRILYSYLCTDSSDWPDVEVLLEQVRLNQQLRRPSTAKSGRPPQNAESPPMERSPAAVDQQKETNGGALAPSAGAAGSDSSGGGEITVHKRKCCVLM